MVVWNQELMNLTPICLGTMCSKKIAKGINRKSVCDNRTKLKSLKQKLDIRI